MRDDDDCNTGMNIDEPSNVHVLKLVPPPSIEDTKDARTQWVIDQLEQAKKFAEAFGSQGFVLMQFKDNEYDLKWAADNGFKALGMLEVAKMEMIDTAK